MSRANPWKAVLFDLDGTLADTVPLILASFRHTMSRHRGTSPPDAEWLEHVGRPLRDTVRHFARDEDDARAMAGRTLQACGVAEDFRVVITADDVVRGKPDSEPVRRALELLGGPRPSETLFIGDSPHDVDAGRAAGVRTAAVTWGAFSRERLAASAPDHLVDRPRDLLSLGSPTPGAGGA